MKKIVNYKIFCDLEIVVEYYQGNVFLEDLIKTKQTIITEEGYHPGFMHIGDFRNSNIQVDDTDIQNYLNHIAADDRMYGKRKAAIITSTPKHVVSATKYEILTSRSPITVKTFSTLEAAGHWLQLSITSYCRIKDSINTMMGQE